MPSETLTKFTITPVDVDQVDERWRQSVITIRNDLTLEEGFVTPNQLDLWKDFISRRERDRLGSVRYALVHRFQGSLAQGKEDDDSRTFMNHVFVCLRLVKPTRLPFQVIQGYLKEEQPEIYSFTHPPIEHVNIPVTQSLNKIKAEDIKTLAALLPTFMNISRPGFDALYLQRAIQFYEQGYSATAEPTLQFMSWMIGVEAVISKRKQIEQSLLANILRERFGGIDIKAPQWRDYFGKAPQPLLVKTQVENLIALRNAIVHAQPVPESLRVMHADYFGHQYQLSAYLCAAAAMILQSAVLQEISALEPRSR
jgi:hypothetical protein